MRQKVLVEGPALTQSGYGEHARLVLRALKLREDVLDIYVNPLNWGTTSWILGDFPEREWIESKIVKLGHLPDNQRSFDIHIRVGIPNEFERYAPHAVVVTAGIETTKVSPKWIEKSHQMTKLVVPSEFSKWVFENTKYDVPDENGVKHLVGCGAPIDVVHYPVPSLEKEEIDLELEHDFNFLIVAQWSIRKNLENTIRWFVEEFKNDNVGLVIKTNTSKNSLMDRIHTENRLRALLEEKQFSGRKCKIYLLHGDMSREELNSLYTHPKIKSIVSATHGEGYGLPLFEAACNGLPVVAPGWSGHLDFLYGPLKSKNGKVKNKPLFARVDYVLAPVQKEAVWKDILPENSMWCFVNRVDFKKKIRAMYTNNGMYASWAKKLQKHILENFKEEDILDRMLNSIIPETVLHKPDLIFVSDMFASQYQGGAELSLQALIESVPDNPRIGAINSQNLTQELVESNKDAKWVFGNISQLPTNVMGLFSNGDMDYSFVEFDYKFCKHRNPLLYEMVEGEPCKYLDTEKGSALKSFMESAKSVFFMSESQKKIHEESLDLDSKNTHVLSSLFGKSFFTYIEGLENKTKNKKDGWVVLGSNSWVKGAEESEQWCKDSDLDYEVLWGLKPEEFLTKLAKAKGVCFLPSGLDTCPRFIIEAKLLGCELELNENVQHSEEEWFNRDRDGIIEYLKSRPVYFWENAF
tara:strand:+ start:930 stop:3011 length:2082 start_codon:yes stop_codon:yes gene_type:complete